MVKFLFAAVLASACGVVLAGDNCDAVNLNCPGPMCWATQHACEVERENEAALQRYEERARQREAEEQALLREHERQAAADRAKQASSTSKTKDVKRKTN